MHRRHLLLGLASATCLPACGGGGGSGDGPDTAAPPAPADLLDLAHVTLTLPVKADGTTGGMPARTLKTAELLPSAARPRGYESEFFRATVLEGTGGASAVMLWCPVTGALSSATSDSPRTEFRHQRQTGVNDGWTIGAGSPVAMALDILPTQMPPLRGTVIVAQIHGWQMTDARGAVVSAPPLLLVVVERRDDRRRFQAIDVLQLFLEAHAAGQGQADVDDHRTVGPQLAGDLVDPRPGYPQAV